MPPRGPRPKGGKAKAKAVAVKAAAKRAAEGAKAKAPPKAAAPGLFGVPGLPGPPLPPPVRPAGLAPGAALAAAAGCGQPGGVAAPMAGGPPPAPWQAGQAPGGQAVLPQPQHFHAGGGQSPWVLLPYQLGAIQHVLESIGSPLRFLEVMVGRGGLGTLAILLPTVAYTMDAWGCFVEATLLGVSEVNGQAGAVSSLVPGAGGVLHLCSAGGNACTAQWPGRAVLHVEAARWRSPEDMAEPWLGCVRVLTDRLQRATAPPRHADRVQEAQNQQAQDLKDYIELRGIKRKHDEDNKDQQGMESLFDMKKKKKKKKKKQESTSSSDSDSDLYKSGLTGGRIHEVAEKHPGLLFKAGLLRMCRLLNTRSGGQIPRGQPVVVPYLMSIWSGRYPTSSISLRTSRELRTLAEALDYLLLNLPKKACDVLMQRYKALEQSVADQNWTAASMLEIIPQSDLGVASQAELRAAAREQKAVAKRKMAVP